MKIVNAVHLIIAGEKNKGRKLNELPSVPHCSLAVNQ